MRHTAHARHRILFALLAATLLTLAPALSAHAAQDQPVTMQWEVYHAATDDSDILAVLWFTPAEGFHAYANPSGDTGLPTTLTLAPLPDGSEPVVLYPPGTEERDIFEKDKTVFILEGRTPIFVHIPRSATGMQDAALAGSLRMLLCSATSCWPVERTVRLDIGTLSASTLTRAEDAPWWPRYLEAAGSRMPDEPSPSLTLAAPAGESPLSALHLEPRYTNPGLEVTGLGKAVLLALIAGFILNFMPCVLPVVSLKISALMGGAGEADEALRIRRFREHNIFFSLGILLYFGLLAALFSSLELAWGEVFQHPDIVLGATAVVFALSLSLFGVFDLPVIDLKTGQGPDNPRMQALFTGMLATLLATPCSGPFLGGVLGWVLMQPPLTIATVFASIGLGMASPFLAMAARPGLARRFPRPGAWTGYLETGVGLFLVATCIYLLGILPEQRLPGALVYLWVIAVAAWIWGRWTNLSQTARRRWSIRALAVALVVAAWPLIMRPAEPTPWTGFDESRFMETLGTAPILVDFTAEWCPNCKALEKTTLSPDNLRRWAERWDLHLVQADLTEPNPAASALLQKLGSQSIPVVAIFPPGENARRPIVLRDLFTPAQMDEALKDALETP
ncbi:thiol:disulfide interchange protein DsbD [Desulfobaculum xiamenense]|uniref:Thiol:disulfide interchange protein DsbD n=1 Tax=Desulfobaculum xiamenense TaxID=995050 RepID=A0A846QQ39_9BACT|nr:cytochrome c biogenesis protein CcdA [Desulfobaculum xiamenense]NJB67334.1 thiol:disulfide interchange protein DsbD [Desulfobaculum xiamenense]